MTRKRTTDASDEFAAKTRLEDTNDEELELIDDEPEDLLADDDEVALADRRRDPLRRKL